MILLATDARHALLSDGASACDGDQQYVGVAEHGAGQAATAASVHDPTDSQQHFG